MYWPVNTDYTSMQSTLTMMLGYQGWTQFNINLNIGAIATFAANCTNANTGQSSALSPFYTTNYFNTTYVTNYGQYNETWDGYNTTGFAAYTEVCMAYSGANSWQTGPTFCTIGENEIYVVSTIYKDTWNLYNNASAGVIGLGVGSPLWNIQNLESQSGYIFYALELTNYHDWSWLNTASSAVNWTQSVSASTITTGWDDNTPYMDAYNNGEYINYYFFTLDNGELYGFLNNFGFG
jgi:hypothetical protein